MEVNTKPTARSFSTQDLSDDEIQLRAQGHTAFAAILTTPLYAGGGPSAVYALLVATVACSFINAGLAELASAFPSSGGQYDFTYMVAAPKNRAVLAFACGWLSVLTWAVATSPAYSFCAQLILIIASFLHPEYESTRWQVYLIYTLLIIIAAVIVIYMPRQLPPHLLNGPTERSGATGWPFPYQQVLACTCMWVWVHYGAAIGCLVTSGRKTWALARDNGLPYSSLFARIHPKLQTPAAATLLTAAFITIYGAIYVGSTMAFDGFVSLAILGLNTSYAIPQTIVLLHGRDNVLSEKEHFDLGAVTGPFCNAFSVAWVALYTVLFCFPVFLPVTPESVNYLSVVVVGVWLFILVLWWGGKRKTFTGPIVNLDNPNSVELIRSPSSISNSGNPEMGSDLKRAAC